MSCAPHQTRADSPSKGAGPRARDVVHRSPATKRLILVGSTTNVASSNLGTFNLAAGRPDGTGADYLVIHVVYPGMTKSLMHWIGGLRLLVSGKVLRQVFLIGSCLSAWLPEFEGRLRTPSFQGLERRLVCRHAPQRAGTVSILDDH